LTGRGDRSVTGFSGTSTARLKDFALLTGRMGWAADNWLFYAKGGVALGRSSSSSVGVLANGTLFETGSSSTDRSGWIVGAGVEWGFAPGWSAKIEYEHFDFGSTNVGVNHIATTGCLEHNVSKLHWKGRRGEGRDQLPLQLGRRPCRCELLIWVFFSRELEAPASSGAFLSATSVHDPSRHLASPHDLDRKADMASYKSKWLHGFDFAKDEPNVRMKSMSFAEIPDQRSAGMFSSNVGASPKVTIQRASVKTDPIAIWSAVLQPRWTEAFRFFSPSPPVPETHGPAGGIGAFGEQHESRWRHVEAVVGDGRRLRHDSYRLDPPLRGAPGHRGDFIAGRIEIRNLNGPVASERHSSWLSLRLRSMILPSAIVVRQIWLSMILRVA